MESAYKVSLPPLPFRVSAPPLPVKILALASPLRVSAEVVPVRFSKFVAPAVVKLMLDGGLALSPNERVSVPEPPSSFEILAF